MFTSRSQRIVSKCLQLHLQLTSQCDCDLLWDFMQEAP